MDSRLDTTPSVSIMMATYNREAFIDEAIKSVRAQTCQNWELLILDDASTDNTFAIVSSYISNDPRIKWLPAKQNLGITKNRNRGFAFAQGKYIAVLDSDDTWCDVSKLEKQVQFLEAHPEYVVVGTQVSVINAAGGQIGEFKYNADDADIRKRMLLRNQFTHSSLLLQRSALGDDKPYDEGVSIWEDYELLLRIGTKGKLANLEEKLTCYRKHTSNITKSGGVRDAMTHLRIIKRYRSTYPNYLSAVLWGYARVIKAFIK